MTNIQVNLAKPSLTQSLARDQRGLTTVEYVIVLVLIAVVGIGVWRTFGQNLSAKINEAASSVQGL